MKINVYNYQKDLPILSSAVKKIVKAALLLEKEVCEEVSIYFVTADEICRMHEEYFNDPSLTDCISFPIDDCECDTKYRVLGEVFVCPQTAIEYAQKHKVNTFEECTLYIVHGLLHLMGYDDMESRAKAAMRRAEKKHLTHLKKLNLLLRSKSK